MFKGPDTEINLDVFSSGCPEIERMLMFRDWLRSNAADRDLYARTKQAFSGEGVEGCPGLRGRQDRCHFGDYRATLRRSEMNETPEARAGPVLIFQHKLLERSRS